MSETLDTTAAGDCSIVRGATFQKLSKMVTAEDGKKEGRKKRKKKDEDKVSVGHDVKVGKGERPNSLKELLSGQLPSLLSSLNGTVTALTMTRRIGLSYSLGRS